MENTKQRKYGSKVGVLAILGLLAFIICLRSSWNPFWGRKAEGAETDSNVFYYVGQQMQNGELPYRDTFDHQGLCIYWINVIGNVISKDYGIWILEVLFVWGTAIVGYKLARKFTSKMAAILIIAIAFSMLSNYFTAGNHIEEYALFFQMMVIYVFVDFFKEPEKYACKIEKQEKRKIRFHYRFFNIPIALTGVCCAFLFFLRENLLVPYLVFGIMIFLYCMTKGKYKELANYLFSFLSGALLASLPMIIYLTTNGIWNEFVQSYLVFSKKYVAFLSILSRVDVLSRWINLSIVIISILIVAMKLFFQIRKKENWHFNLGYLFYMVIVLILASISGRFRAYYGIGLVPMLVYPFCILYEFLEQRKLKEIHLDIVVTVFLVYTIMVTAVNNYAIDITEDSMKKNSKDAVVEYILQNTQESDTISVFGNLNYVYNQTNRKSASKYSYQYPIAGIEPKFMEEYLQELKEKKPKLIIWALSKWKEETLKIEPMMKKFLEENGYEVVQEGDIPIYAVTEEVKNERMD